MSTPTKVSIGIGSTWVPLNYHRFVNSRRSVTFRRGFSL